MTLKLNGTTSGSVSIDAPATGSNISFTLPGSVGTSGQLLSTDGAGVLSFVNGGKILQVVNSFTSSQLSTTSTSLQDTGLSATITPSLSSSKVLILVSQNGVQKDAGNAGSGVDIDLIRTSTGIGGIVRFAGYTNSSLANHIGGVSICVLDSPATTSAITYKTQFLSRVSGQSVYVQAQSSLSTITLLEVAA